jgi:hypothetical protein
MDEHRLHIAVARQHPGLRIGSQVLTWTYGCLMPGSKWLETFLLDTKEASSLGRMLEVDWNSLFTSFFGMVRVKIACKDVDKIPVKRMFEMNKMLYLIHFKVEKGGGGGMKEEMMMKVTNLIWTMGRTSH